MKKGSSLIVWLSIGVVVAGVGQASGLPLFLAAFQEDGKLKTGPYFVVWFCSLMFNVLFWPAFALEWWRGSVSPETVRYTFSKRHYKIFFTGLFNSLNGILTVYASSALRVPPAFQPILLQCAIPATLVFSKLFLGKKYNIRQIAGAIVVLLAIVVFLIPTFIDIHNGKKSSHFDSGWWWPVILAGGTLPLAWMNIFEEAVFRDEPTYNISLLLALSSLYQLICVSLLFWSDVIKGFGTSSNIHVWSSQFVDGWKCLGNSLPGAHRCEYCFGLAAVFILAYTFTYVFGSQIMRTASANYQGILTSITNPLVVLFWVCTPSLNKWAGGASYRAMDTVFALLSIPLMVGGALMFRYYEAPHHPSERTSVMEARLLPAEPKQSNTGDVEAAKQDPMSEGSSLLRIQ